MTTFTVYFTKVTEISVKVDAEDYDAAIDAAYDLIPPLSAEASGWGQGWTRDESDESEPEQVRDNDTEEVVWESGERWTRTAGR